MEEAPKPFEGKPEIKVVNADKLDLVDPRFTFGKGFEPSPKKPKALSARERWEAAAAAADRRRASRG